MTPKYLPLLMLLASAGACGPAEDVEVLPLPALERPSREARLGIPEVAGSWRFAGWEIVRGDSTALERTFPSFGELRLDTQRLDSIAGTFDLAGGRRGVMGEIRKDGNLSLVTYGGGDLGRYIAGRFAKDTLWLELTSVLPAEEWPRDARAAFVRTPVGEAITWVRGARPGDLPPPVDSTALMVDSLGRPLAPAGVAPPAGGVPQPVQPGARLGGQVQPAAPRPGGAQPARPQPSGGQQPPQTQPRPSAPAPAPAPRPAAPPAAPRPAPRDEPPAPTPVRPAPAPAPAPAPPPAPPPEPDDDQAPPLLGDPVL